MNNKDLAVMNCEFASNIKGIELLWIFLVKTKNDKIRNSKAKTNYKKEEDFMQMDF